MAFQFQHQTHSLPGQSTRVHSHRRASVDAPSAFLAVHPPLPRSSSPSASNHRSHSNPKTTSPTSPKLKRSNSQPNLLPFSHHHNHPITHLPSNNLQPQQISHELIPQDDQYMAITRFPRRCSPKIVNRHKRTGSVASSISSAVTHQQQLLILNRHHLDQDEDGDEIEIEGGMSGLLRAAEEEYNQNHDSLVDERRASESCGSSAVGEPMVIDSEPNPKPSYVGAKKVRRKPVNRANLLPRPKSHLRVAAQLSTEDVSPDLLTEAEVHRRFKSIPFVVPQPSSSTPTNTLPSVTPSNSPLIPRTPSSPFYHHLHRPTPNRFPEQVDDDVDDNRFETKSSSSDDEPAEDHQSHCSGLRHSVMSQDEESEDQKILEIQKWKMFRGSGSSSSCGPMDISRAGGKRKCPDAERYEQGMFKRRAVSPSSTSLSSCIGSPILNPVSIPHSSLATTSSNPTPNPISIHQPLTVSSSSSSSASSLGFRPALPVHQHIIQHHHHHPKHPAHQKHSASTPDRDDPSMSNHSSCS